MSRTSRRVVVALTLAVGLACAVRARAAGETPHEADYIVRNFRFGIGDSTAALRIHYLTLGQPVRDKQGGVTNAILILHGTGGTGRQFMANQFASVLYGAGALLDTTRYYIILPDGIGHGHSSKPSDGLHANFPHYDYDDMVEAQYRLVTEGLGVRHLRLVMGTSMGGMHTWVWGETHPDFMDALMPLACQPVAIVGRNRLWRRMIIEAIRSDPAWHDGEYTTEPTAALRTALDIQIIAGSAPLLMQTTMSTRDSVDRYLANTTATRLPPLDANDVIYQLDASRNYDPSPKLGAIVAPVMFVNSADDFINPPELGIAEREIKRVKHGKFVLLPIDGQTHGHGTHTWAAVWKQYLAELLELSKR